ncbi:Carboxypeptidase N subunit 2 [Holothuria leucospilota]|uniref:Carboxypeptidase N subunit 2 n=1 Tax=Holothuria leucospilota TaxID=206669 RepID=A0A9Q1HIX0_HOLLE|nr:Carboxypeptidase N subunit 2 [Holothuria leucospilota]
MIPEELLLNVPRLRILWLHGNMIRYLPAKLFEKTIRLEEIQLYENRLEEIPEELLQNVPLLKLIYLDENRIKRIPEDLFRNVSQLEVISFNRNMIDHVPAKLFEKTTLLEELYLQFNQLLDLPEEMLKTVSNLQNIELSNNEIEQLPLKLFSFNNKSHDLTELFLQRNRITYLQSGLFLGLPNLTILCLFDNQIKLIESTVFSTTSVKIYLFGNKMENFTYDSFKNKLMASEIHLYRNNITAISGNATRKVPSRLYINCDQLQEVHGINVQMNCVGPEFAPKISLSSEDDTEEYIASILRLEGFACTLNNVTKYYSCVLCPQGTYSNGLNKCIPCPKGGFYQDEIGSYSNVSGQLICEKCANGTYVNETGGTSQKDCIICPDGTNTSIHAGFRACFCNNGFA